MQNSHMDEYRNSSNGSTGNSSEVVVEQSADFSTEIMNVTEMEQSPDGSPNVNATTDENEIANAVDLPVAETEANFPPEYEKFWKTVENNPQDFTGWVYLLQYVEQENHLMAARKAFDKFFIHYPYCYGYWKKYADLEKRHDNIKQSDEVYRRGLQAIPLSVDLWIHYINFLKETLDPGDSETNSTIRGTFEHAVLAAGTDFRSDRLWEMYINWENEQGNLREVTAIYDRILGIPTQLYSHHFQRFKEHVQNNLPRDLLTGEQFIQLRRELASVNGHSGDDGPPGDDLPSGIEDITDPAKLITEIENMRHRIIEIHQEMFNYNEHEVSKRWTFEEGIKRPYFHVKPLEKAQLKNWKEYLEFEIENGTHERVVVLFERCVISCALYEEFWIKYAKYMENHSIEGVRHVFSRACTIHLPKKPVVHMLWAAFEEQQGNINEARNILRTFEECVLGLAMVRLRRENTKLYLNLLEMEYSGDLKQNEENILNCFDKAIHGSLPVKMRITFSQRKVEFLEDFGSDVNKLLSAYDEHQTLLKEQDSLKRKAENGSEEPEEKKAHTEDTTASSAQLIDGDLQANQAAYNYSAWYQYNYQNPWNYGQYYPPPPT
ncbi:pre-mRNA-processing factor 39 isoform X3 [Myotis myotis]|uniref:pre-mRNA-processing factor 39 isoform X3 n=1 Tax=Myotis myotis TaxID=51298 RepID=UPI00174CB957|nr:pre-mRNA-processing factor 39 isoform X3 [Myotis myotis]